MSSKKLVILIGSMFLFLIACTDNSGTPRKRRAHLPTDKPKVWSSIRNVSVIVLENTDFEDAMSQPFFKQLSQKGALLTSYYAITHPSQPNYIALISGQTQGVDNNENVTLSARHIGDLLEESGKTWRSYAEGYPGNCFLLPSEGDYFRKHVPFLSFKSVQSNSVRCGYVVNGSAFKADLKSQSLPNFSLYIPDMNNDGHNTGIAYADNWLSKFFKDILEDPKVLADTVFVVTFDEGSRARDNRVATLILGAGVQPNVTSSQDYDHYCLLKTIEGIFNLPDLGNYDRTAPMIDDIWLSQNAEISSTY